MTAPSNLREALGPFAKAADNYADCADDDKFIDDDATVTVGNLREARAALATLSPKPEAREAIANLIRAFVGTRIEATNYGLKYKAEDLYNLVDGLLSSGLMQDSQDEGWTAAARRAVIVAKESGSKTHPRVAAIRSRSDGGEQG